MLTAMPPMESDASVDGPPQEERSSSSSVQCPAFPSRTGLAFQPTQVRKTHVACGECRKRRSKCDGLRPECSRCQSKALSCTYSERGESTTWLRRRLRQIASELEDIKSVLQLLVAAPDRAAAAAWAAELARNGVRDYTIESLRSALLCHENQPPIYHSPTLQSSKAPCQHVINSTDFKQQVDAGAEQKTSSHTIFLHAENPVKDDFGSKTCLENLPSEIMSEHSHTFPEATSDPTQDTVAGQESPVHTASALSRHSNVERHAKSPVDRSMDCRQLLADSKTSRLERSLERTTREHTPHRPESPSALVPERGLGLRRSAAAIPEGLQIVVPERFCQHSELLSHNQMLAIERGSVHVVDRPTRTYILGWLNRTPLMACVYMFVPYSTREDPEKMPCIPMSLVFKDKLVVAGVVLVSVGICWRLPEYLLAPVDLSFLEESYGKILDELGDDLAQEQPRALQG